MPKLVVPGNPHNAEQVCNNCLHWLRSKKQVMAIMNEQGNIVPLGELIKQGHDTSKLNTATIAQCTQAPNWTAQTEDHWCSLFFPIKAN